MVQINTKTIQKKRDKCKHLKWFPPDIVRAIQAVYVLHGENKVA